MPLSRHHSKSGALNTEKLRVWNGLTAGPDIHRFSIGIFPQDLRGQVTWGASKTCSRREGGGTLNPLSLSLDPPSAIFPESLLTSDAFATQAPRAWAARGDRLGFLYCPESQSEGKSMCLPGTAILPRGSKNTVLTTARLTALSHVGPAGRSTPSLSSSPRGGQDH